MSRRGLGIEVKYLQFFGKSDLYTLSILMASMASNSDQNQTPSQFPNQEASPSANSSPPPLQFITLTERPGSNKNDYSYTVRSHAMQAFLHEKKNAKGDKEKQRLGSARPHDPQTSKQLSGKFKLDSWSRNPRSKKAKTASQATRDSTSPPIVVKEEVFQSEVRKMFCKYRVTCSSSL